MAKTAALPKGMKKVQPLTPEESTKARGATRSRKKFEATNPERMATVADKPFGTSGKTGAQLGVSPKTLYDLHGYHNQEPPSPHGLDQPTLPGMASVAEARAHGTLSGAAKPSYQSKTLPDQAPSPAKWEDMHPEAQKRTLQGAAKFGVTPASMHRSFGAQLDQGHARAAEHGMTPYASHFYSGDDPSRPSEPIPSKEVLNHPDYVPPKDMQPKDVLLRSAKANDVDFGTQVVANAITSPKSKFRMERKGGGVTYPNDQAATFAIQAVHHGTAPADIDPSGHGIVALHGNVRRAGYAVQQRDEGSHVSDLHNPPSKSSPEGSTIFGPKTGPYNNSWTDTHGQSQMLVSDVHTGGGGMAPHLSHENAYQRDESGGAVLTASGRKRKEAAGSERENYLSVPGIHALHDHVARNVMHERGLSSLSGAQATQWGEEQISRGEGNAGARKQTLVPTDKAYPHAPAHEEVSGQESLFHDRRGG
jgi:hypothetical protein